MKNTSKKEIDANEIILSMELMKESKAHLLTFINACGFDKGNREYKRIDFLVKQRSDVLRWVEIFVKRFDSDVDDIKKTTDEFKEYKVKNSTISLLDFILASTKNLKTGLEEYFQVECSSDDLIKISEKLHSNELDLTFIYEKCKENNWYNSVDKFFRSKWNIA